MARGTRGPANTPEQSVQQQLDALSQRVRELETKRVLAAPVSSLDKTRDPVDGEHMVDHRDGSTMWFKDSDWRYGLPSATYQMEQQEIAFEANPLDREFQTLNVVPYLNVFSSSELFYTDEDFPDRLYVRTPGTYMAFLSIGQSNAVGFRSFLQLGIDGEGLYPSGIIGLGFNPWFQTFGNLMSTGDPMESPSLQPEVGITNLSHMLIGSFWDHSEEALDFQYQEDNPDDDEEIPFPSYTRWFTASVRNDGPDTVSVYGPSLTVIRISNRQLV